MELAGKTAIVTGSGRGIGRALALEFSRQGANVVCCARSKEEIRETVALLEKERGHGIAVPTDVTRKEQVETMVKEALEHFGQIDILFNNAGSFQAIGGVWEVNPEVWWHDVTVNLRGTMLCCQAVLPHMIERDEGVIINMAGGGFDRPFPGGSGYACSKTALMRLTDSLAKELERVSSSVLVFGMDPGFVRTSMTEYQLKTPEGRKWMTHVSRGFAQNEDRPPEDCAKATVQLIRIASPELNGRIFDPDKNFAAVAKQASGIEEKDLFVLRLRSWDE